MRSLTRHVLYALQVVLLSSVLIAIAEAQDRTSGQNVLPEQPQAGTSSGGIDRAPAQIRSSYVLGPDDQITIRVTAAEEIVPEPIRIDMSGYIRLPMAGRVRAAGLTVEDLETELVSRLKNYILDPQVTVNINEFRSQPVSVLGAVKTPGVQQLQGRKTLFEMLSLAGGLDANAGPKVKITRGLEWGRLPLKDAVTDPTGKFSIAEVSVKSILDAKNPEQNIVIKPYDVISVPRAEIVYVTGQVMKSGGFVLNEHESITVLQALSLAGGLDRAASPKHSRILRASNTNETRTEMAVDVAKILDGRAKDVPLRADDILFIPASVPKKAAIRAVEAAIQMGTGVVIWRGRY